MTHWVHMIAPLGLIVIIFFAYEEDDRHFKKMLKSSSIKCIVRYPISLQVFFAGCILIVGFLVVYGKSTWRPAQNFVDYLFIVVESILLVFIIGFILDVFSFRITYIKNEDHFTYRGIQTLCRKVTIYYQDVCYIDKEKGVLCYQKVMKGNQYKYRKLYYTTLFHVGFFEFEKELNRNRVKHKLGRHIM